MSAHGALARQYAFALPTKIVSAWQTELNTQLFRETEIISLLLRATSWEPDLALGYMAISWEVAWLPMPIDGVQDSALAAAAGVAVLAHAIHAKIRPAALVPSDADATDPFVMALRRVEFESGHLLQAQILLLKSADLIPFRDAVSASLEKRHAQIGNLWVTPSRASVSLSRRGMTESVDTDQRPPLARCQRDERSASATGVST